MKGEYLLGLKYLMRFLQRLFETNIPPNRIPKFDDFVHEWRTELPEWRLPDTHVDDPANEMPDGFTPAHLQMLVDRINAVDLSNLYRGIIVTQNFLDSLKPGMELGIHWTWDRNIADNFSDGGGMDNYDSRFEEHQEDVEDADETFAVIFHGAVMPEAIDVEYTLGKAIDGFEKEIELYENRPIRLYGLYVSKRGGYATIDGKFTVIPNGDWVHMPQYAGIYHT